MSRQAAPIIILVLVTLPILAVVAFLDPLPHWIMLSLMTLVMVLLLASVVWKLEIVD